MTDDVDSTQTAFAVADATGKIVMAGTIPAFMIDTQPMPDGGSRAVGKATLDKHYVLNGTILERPANPTTITGMKLLNVPNPSTVTIDGASPHQVTDGEVDLSFTQPGTYTVVVSSWPALDATFQVTQP